MSATFQWCESNGVGETETRDISNVNFGNVDSPNIVPASHPINVGENSFCKYIRGLFTGDFTTISNIKFWKSSGDLKTGETIKASAYGDYSAPSADDTGDSEIPTTEETALLVLAEELESNGEISNESSSSGYTAYIRLQNQTTISTPAGSANQKEFTISYDEL
jgi:hypothetical protein